MRQNLAWMLVAAGLAVLMTGGVALAQTCSFVGQCGDLDQSGKVTVTDALNLLKKSVGQTPNLKCECGGGGDPACEADLATCTDALAACQAKPACGDAKLDDGEDCDIGLLGGATCESLGFEGGTLGCSFCVFDTSACYETRFVDNGTTIVDLKTGLEWEKKDSANLVKDYANPHDVDNDYTWCAGSGFNCDVESAPLDGTIASDFLAKLNGTSSGVCYQDHCDWRLPTLDELKTLALLPEDCTVAPCVADSLLLPMRSSYYWSSTSYLFNASIAWLVDFNTGQSSAGYKPTKSFVRAVRSAT